MARPLQRPTPAAEVESLTTPSPLTLAPAPAAPAKGRRGATMLSRAAAGVPAGWVAVEWSRPEDGRAAPRHLPAAQRQPEPHVSGLDPLEQADQDLLVAEISLLVPWLDGGGTAVDLASFALSRARATLRDARAGQVSRAEGDRANAVLLAHRAGQLEVLAARALTPSGEALRLAGWRSVVPASKDRAAAASVVTAAARVLAGPLKAWNTLADAAQDLRRRITADQAQLLQLTERALSETDEAWARRWRSEAVDLRARVKGEQKRLRELGDEARALRAGLPSPEAVADAWSREQAAPAGAWATAVVLAEHAIHWLWDDTAPRRWLSRCGAHPAPPEETEGGAPAKRWRTRADMTFLGAPLLPAGTLVEELALEAMSVPERLAWKASEKSRKDQRLETRKTWEKELLEALTPAQRSDRDRRAPLWAEAGDPGERAREKWLREAARALKRPRLPEAVKVIPFRWQGGLRYGEVGHELASVGEGEGEAPPPLTLPPPLPPAAAEAEARIQAALEVS